MFDHLEDPEFINAIGLELRNRDIRAFNAGAHGKKTIDRAAIIETGMSATKERMHHLQRLWPDDLILAESFAKIVYQERWMAMKGKDGKGVHAHEMDELGIVRPMAAVRVGADNDMKRYRVLRNPEKYVLLNREGRQYLDPVAAREHLEANNGINSTGFEPEKIFDWLDDAIGEDVVKNR